MRACCGRSQSVWPPGRGAALRARSSPLPATVARGRGRRDARRCRRGSRRRARGSNAPWAPSEADALAMSAVTLIESRFRSSRSRSCGVISEAEKPVILAASATSNGYAVAAASFERTSVGGTAGQSIPAPSGRPPCGFFVLEGTAGSASPSIAPLVSRSQLGQELGEYLALAVTRVERPLARADEEGLVPRRSERPENAPRCRSRPTGGSRPRYAPTRAPS